MQYRLINNVSEGTLKILAHKIVDDDVRQIIAGHRVDALGICQGNIAEVLCASDIAFKASNVKVCEIRGNCPQHLLSLAIIGDVSAVKSAMDAVKQVMNQKS